MLQTQKHDTAVLIEFAVQLHELPLKQQLDDASRRLVLNDTMRLIASNFTMKAPPQLPAYGYQNHWSTYGHVHSLAMILGASEMTRFLRLTIDLGHQDLIPALLNRISETGTALSQNELECIMLPFLRELLTIAKENNIDWSAGHFKNIFTQSLQRCLSASVRPEPPLPQTIEPQRVGCGCVRCQQLDRLLQDTDAKQENFREYAKERRHLEERLQRIRTKNLVTWSSQREGKGPEVLRVSKTDGHVEHKAWLRARAGFRDKVKTVASWRDLDVLLGNSFVEIVCTTRLIGRIKLPKRLLPALTGFREPERIRKWLREHFVADACTTLPQQDLWYIYKMTFEVMPSPHEKFPAAELLSMVPEVIPGAGVEVGAPFFMRGLRVRTRARDGDGSGQANARPPNSAFTASTKDTSVKRKIDVVDLCASP